MTTRLTREKNISLAIKVVADLVRNSGNSASSESTNSGIGLVVVGDGPEKKSLVALVDKLWTNKNVVNVVFEPWQDPETLFSYYKTADLFLSTSWYEGYGLSIAEAASASLPIVATDAGIAKELTDFVCLPGDKNCLVEKISKIYNHTVNPHLDLSGLSTRLGKVVIKNNQEYLESYRENIEQALSSHDISKK